MITFRVLAFHESLAENFLNSRPRPPTSVGGRRSSPDLDGPPLHSHGDWSTHVVPGTGTRSPRDQCWSLNKVNPKVGLGSLESPEKHPFRGALVPAASRTQGPYAPAPVLAGHLAKFGPVCISAAALPCLPLPCLLALALPLLYVALALLVK